MKQFDLMSESKTEYFTSLCNSTLSDLSNLKTFDLPDNLAIKYFCLFCLAEKLPQVKFPICFS